MHVVRGDHHQGDETEALSPAQRQRQAAFESIDYYKAYTKMYIDHLWKRAFRWKRARVTATESVADQLEERAFVTQWALHVVIAIVVGGVAVLVSETIARIEQWRVSGITQITEENSNGFVAYVQSMLFWVASSVALVAVSTLVVVFFETAAGGSGIPEVMAYLNGVALPKVLNLKTFIAKTVSVVGAVSGGLPVGAEAPLIHLGAIVGSGVPQGRSRTLGCQSSFFRGFRNNKSRRDFITAGAACGVSAAFGAPIGGLLFVMEEVSSFWDVTATARIFLGTMITFAVSAFISSLTEDVNGRKGFVSNKASVMFEVEYTGADPLNVASIIPAALLGLIAGLLAVAFTKGNLAVVKWRRENVKPFPLKRCLEPIIAAAIFSFVGFTLPYLLPCHPTVDPAVSRLTNATGDVKSWHTENGTHLAKFLCPTPHTYSPLATLTTTGIGKGAIRRLFSRRTVGEFSFPVLLVFLVLYAAFAVFIGGAALASGTVIPTIMIGAVIGRMYGLLLVYAFAETVTNKDGRTVGAYFADEAWMDPGVFALIGAGAFFGGVSRMTISLCVIMVELSGELHYLLPIMIAIATAKSVADVLCVPLYHQLMHLDFIPYLPAVIPGVDLELLTAGDVSSEGAVCLQLHERVAVVIDALQTGHNCFPVVHGTKFIGTATRDDLQVLLALPQFQSRVAETAQRLLRAAQSSQARELTQIAEADSGAQAMGLPGMVDVSYMEYEDWLRHQMALFFVQGSQEWHRNWSPAGIAQRERDLAAPAAAATTPSTGGPVAGLAAEATPRCDVTTTPGIALQGLGSPTLSHCVSGHDDSIVMNIDPVVNRSPWSVPRSMNLSLVFQLFRTLGIRSIIVVDGERVTGVITRKDLLPHELRLVLRRVRQHHFLQEEAPSAGEAAAARRVLSGDESSMAGRAGTLRPMLWLSGLLGTLRRLVRISSWDVVPQASPDDDSVNDVNEST